MALLKTLDFIINHPMNRGNRFRSILRFLNWQIASRMAPGAILYEWVNGAKFVVKKGETGLTGNIYAGLHEHTDMGYLLHVLRGGDLFLDIGANVGCYTLLASASVGANTIAFEPVPTTFKRLTDNIRINGLDQKVQCVNQGLGDQEGEISFSSEGDTMNHALAPGEACAHPVTVPITTLDSFLSHQSPSLAKIDVEGFETLVLKGARKTLENPSLHSLIMELNDSGQRYGFDEGAILKALSDLGYQTHSYNPFTRVLTPLASKNTQGENTLFIRDKSFVEERLKTAPKFRINGVEL